MALQCGGRGRQPGGPPGGQGAAGERLGRRGAQLDDARGGGGALDPAYRPVVAGLVVWAVVAGDEDVATVLVSPTLAAARR
jgi:hypothetical protein